MTIHLYFSQEMSVRFLLLATASKKQTVRHEAPPLLTLRLLEKVLVTSWNLSTLMSNTRKRYLRQQKVLLAQQETIINYTILASLNYYLS